MAKRGLGAKGYYSRGEDAGAKPARRRQSQTSEEERSKNRAIVLFILVGAALFFFLALKEKPGVLPEWIGGATPLPIGIGTATPSPSVSPTPLSPTLKPSLAPGETPTPVGAGTPTPFGTTPSPTPANASARFFINTTQGPTSYGLGETILSVIKSVVVTEDSYNEQLDVQNVGNATANFNLIDIIPPQLGVTVWDATFAKEFEALSSTMASFSYVLEPGESMQHATALPTGNTTSTVSNVFADSSRTEVNAESPFLEPEFLESNPYVPQSLQQALEYNDLLSEIADIDEQDVSATLEEQSDYLEATSDTASQLGLTLDQVLSCTGPRPLNYSALEAIRMKVSEKTQASRVTIPLDEYSGPPLFDIEGKITDYAQVTHSVDSEGKCYLNITINFSSQYIQCGLFPFDRLVGNLSLYFPKTGKQYKVPIVVTVEHKDLLGGATQLTDCEDANKVLVEARKHVGEYPRSFGCPSPGCACYSSSMYEDADLRLFPHNNVAAEIYRSLENKAESGNAKIMNNPSASELQPADLVFYVNSWGVRNGRYKHIGHVAIYMGNGKKIDSGSVPVSIDPLGSPSYAGRVINCKKGEEGAGTSPTPTPQGNPADLGQALPTSDIIPEDQQCLGQLGQSFLALWIDKIAGKERALPPACFDENMNSILSQYMQQNGLNQRGFDKALVLSLIAQESSCNHEVNAGGLMQVDFGCLNQGGCTLEENIDKGTKELAEAFDYAKARGVTNGVLATMVFFGYNRGKGTEDIAITKYRGGEELYDSMKNACFITNPCSAGRSASWCCDQFGLGAGYPEAIASYYATASKDTRLK